MNPNPRWQVLWRDRQGQPQREDYTDKADAVTMLRLIASNGLTGEMRPVPKAEPEPEFP